MQHNKTALLVSSRKKVPQEMKTTPKMKMSIKIKRTLNLVICSKKPVAIFLYSIVKNIISTWTYFIIKSGNFMMVAEK